MDDALDIQFDRIKPRLGSQRKAFEEFSFQLFAREFFSRGRAIRREGAGGDGGLEGFIPGESGRAAIGLQAKYFLGDFKDSWWRQMAESVKTALKANAHHHSLQRHVFCTPLTFTEAQQNKWDDYVRDWQVYALKLGYEVAPDFAHWDRSRLEALLTYSKNRGLLLYYFGYPNFDTTRCSTKTASTIAGLHDRYIPDLHTPVDCEFALHRFLHSDVFWNAFAERTRREAARVLTAPWAIDENWTVPVIEAAKRVEEGRRTIVAELGDGIKLPASFSMVAAAVAEFDAAVAGLETILFEQATDGGSQTISADEKQVMEVLEKMGPIGSLGNWGRWIQTEAELPDSQCCLLFGGAGIGKTQTLAEISTRYEQAGCTVLFIEGRLFTSAENPWTQFLRWLDFPGGVRDFLDSFAALAASTPLPGVICIDALNETPHREVWRHHLHDFASELEAYSNLKLIVSCRTDFIDLTLPPPAVGGPTWVTVEHHGLGAQVIEAAQKYLHAYNVKDFGLTPFTPEFTNPFLLKTFCEAYEGETVPSGSLSLDRILRKYVERKSTNIEARIGCAASVVRDALRDLARMISASDTHALSEKAARELLDSRHSVNDESSRLYSALRSEGLLHELRDIDEFGETISVRFAYERIWDYVLSLHLLPSGGSLTDELRTRLTEVNWRRSNPGLLGLLAVRLPENGHGELHDLTGLQPGDSYEVDQAFESTIGWRTRSNFTARTAQLFNQTTQRDRIDQLFASLVLVPHEEHPWNANHLHEELMGMSLGERDKTWTLRLNDMFSSWYDSTGPNFLIRLGSTDAAETLSDTSAFLLATGLAWISATTNVKGRARAAMSLARLLANRPRVAAKLVRRFSAVNDPYILERVFFAAAACAAATGPSEELAELVETVYSIVFGDQLVMPNIVIRYYAQVVCEQGLRKAAMSSILTEKFRPPYNSAWPITFTEEEEGALESDWNSDTKSKRALGLLLSSTVTEQMGGYGDWGRYEMGWRVGMFQSRRRDKAPLRDWNASGFDDRIARRYVLKRVLELGFDTTLDDARRYDPRVGRSRPPIERLGKKYQWIALHEFLGFLSDHYHPKPDYDSSIPAKLTALDLHLPDLLDPILVPETVRSTRDNLQFVPPSPSWWASVPASLPLPFDHSARIDFVTATDAPDPIRLLIPNDGCETWLALKGHWQWKEPVPCYKGGPNHTPQHCQMSWHINSYAVSFEACERQCLMGT
jgi:hypothetical protein